jgi:hypothetical protein
MQKQVFFAEKAALLAKKLVKSAKYYGYIE